MKALRIDVRDANDVVEAVKTLIQTPEYFQRPEDWDLFCAGLLAMAHADQEFTSEEKSYLERYVPDLKHIEAGAKIVKENPKRTRRNIGRIVQPSTPLPRSPFH